MAIKGIVYVPTHDARGWLGEHAGTQRVAERPLAGLILDALAGDGVRELAVVAADARLDEIRRALCDDACAGLDPWFIGLPGDGGLSAALRAAAGFVGDDPAIVHLATGLLGESATPVVADIEAESADLSLLVYHAGEDGVRLSAEAGRLLGISELDGAASRLSLAAVAVFGPGGVARAARLADDSADDAAPTGTPLQQLIALAEGLARGGATIGVRRVAAWCDYSADPRSLLELNRSVLDRLRTTVAQGPASIHAGNRIEGRVAIHPSADVSASIIIGPATIGARARIADAYVGPYTTVGADAVIENCEIVRSIVGDGARIAHVTGRIEGSTIGRGAHIFRDFTLPRALRLHVGDNVEVSLD